MPCSSCGGKSTKKTSTSPPPKAKIYTVGGKKEIRTTSGKVYSINK